MSMSILPCSSASSLSRTTRTTRTMFSGIFAHPTRHRDLSFRSRTLVERRRDTNRRRNSFPCIKYRIAKEDLGSTTKTMGEEGSQNTRRLIIGWDRSMATLFPPGSLLLQKVQVLLSCFLVFHAQIAYKFPEMASFGLIIVAIASCTCQQTHHLNARTR